MAKRPLGVDGKKNLISLRRRHSVPETMQQCAFSLSLVISGRFPEHYFPFGSRSVSVEGATAWKGNQ